MKYRKKRPLTLKEYTAKGRPDGEYDDYLEQHEQHQQYEEEEFWRWWDTLSDEEKFHYEATSVEAIGERLKSLRKSGNITQEKVAEILGITKQTISNYENGNSRPPSKIVDRLAVLYNTSVSYILGTSSKRESAVENDILNQLEYIKSINTQTYRLETDFIDPEFAPTEKQWLLSKLKEEASYLTTEQLYEVLIDVGLKSLLNLNKNDSTDKFHIL